MRQNLLNNYVCADIDMLTRSTKSFGKSMNLFASNGWSTNWAADAESSGVIFEIQLFTG